MLFAEEFSVEIVLEGVFIHLPDREVGISIHDDTVLIDLLNFCKVDDVGAMDAHESVGQALLHLLHAGA